MRARKYYNIRRDVYILSISIELWSVGIRNRGTYAVGGKSVTYIDFTFHNELHFNPYR